MSENKFDFPTEVVDLPSKGLLYPEGHPLRKGNIEIKYMTAREEDILASQSLIKKGVVLDKLFESVVVEPGVDINDIFIGDKNAILLATRVMGYGANYAYDHADPNGFSGQNCFPDGMERARYYVPVERGHEREIAKRLAYWDKLRAGRQSDDQMS